MTDTHVTILAAVAIFTMGALAIALAYILPADRLRWREEPRVIVSGDWRKANR